MTSGGNARVGVQLSYSYLRPQEWSCPSWPLMGSAFGRSARGRAHSPRGRPPAAARKAKNRQSGWARDCRDAPDSPPLHSASRSSSVTHARRSRAVAESLRAWEEQKAFLRICYSVLRLV